MKKIIIILIFLTKSRIKYQIAKTSYVVLQVFDAGGRNVRTLVNGEQKPGVYQTEFDGTDLSSGIYFYSLVAGNFKETKKMILIK